MTIGPVETQARGGSPKLMPLPDQQDEDARSLIFTAAPNETIPVQPRRPIAPPPPSTNDILAQLARSRPALTASDEDNAEETTPRMSETERNAVIAGVLTDILADADSAFRQVAVLYQDFLVRCRIKRLEGAPLDLNAFRRRFAIARAGVSREDEANEEWTRATVFAHTLPEDIQGVFLIFARAALAKDPCPSDFEIARACGSRSAGRARRLIAYMEQRGYMVCRTDFKGNRIAALPDLGWETGPGNPADDSEPMQFGASGQ